jgi:hypothetical protein
LVRRHSRTSRRRPVKALKRPDNIVIKPSPTLDYGPAGRDDVPGRVLVHGPILFG